MTKIKVVETVDVGYKNGYVECICGWKKALGDGHNVYKIKKCPLCSKDVVFVFGRKVIESSSSNSYNVKIGEHKFFGLSNGLVILFESNVVAEYKGVSFHKAFEI